MKRGWENGYIYAIRHNKTKRIYVGCTKSDVRLQTHFNNLKKGKHANEAMQKDCNEYGYNFTAYLLEVIPRNADSSIDPNEREAYWIHYYCTDDPEKGYNSPRWYTRVDITTFPRIKKTGELEVEIK